MKAFSALISVTDQKYGTTYIYITIAGQPHSFANTLTNALAGARTVLDSRRLAMLLICAIGHKRLLTARLYFDNEPDLAHAHSVDYRYDIELPQLAARRIRVVEISDGGTESEYYKGMLDNFINFQFRRLKKPRGRTPKGFTRTEWEEHHNAPKKDTAPNFVPSSLSEEIERDRRKGGKLPIIDLTGVREYTKEEIKAKFKAENKARRERQKSGKKK